jgi:murein L,D-transpeptidase YafK
VKLAMTRYALKCILVVWVTTAALAAADTAVADRVVVNKSKRELLLLRSGRVIRSYRVALGRNPIGPKEREGDGKTPEGGYIIAGRNPGSAFHRSLRVSYPNDADRERAARRGFRPGGDIMIHGLPRGQGSIGAAHRDTDWTEGCIAVTNQEIEEIWRLVPDGTAMQINP